MTDGILELCGALKAAGIDCVFGVPGTQNVELFDAFRRTRIRTVLASHELGASFMVNGYFRASGKIAALATIPGPGFTYALTGISEAFLDSAAVLYLVGPPATKPGNRFQLQAIDQQAIAGPILKGRFTLADARDVSATVGDAVALATNGEPGPVMIEVDLRALSAARAGIAKAAAPRARAPSTPRSEEFHRLRELFARAERPVFFLGQGAIASATRLERVVTALNVPVFTTPSARGIIPEDHACVLGFDSLRGHVATLNDFLDRADLIVGLGCKLTHNGTAGFALRLPDDRFVHIDRNADVIGVNYDTFFGLAAPVEECVSAFEARRDATSWEAGEISTARRVLHSVADDSRETRIDAETSLEPSEFFARLRGMLPRDAMLVTDSGFHQILTRRYFDVLSPRGLIVPSDFQSMGFGLPAAIGAKLAAPQRPVVALIGDGGFLMSGLELLTALRERAPIITIVFNDGYLNQIRRQQISESGHAYAVRLRNPDFRALAEAFGLAYVRFGEGESEAIARALRDETPLFVEVVVRDSIALHTAAAVTRGKQAVRSVAGEGLVARLRSTLALLSRAR